MASATNPLASLMRNALVARMAQSGGGAPGGPPGTGQGNPEAAGDQLSTQLAELKGADPMMMAKALQQIKGMLVSLYPRAAMQIPKASQAIAKAQKEVDTALAEIQKAAATVNAVRPTPSPIANSANLPSPMAGAADSAGLGA